MRRKPGQHNQSRAGRVVLFARRKTATNKQQQHPRGRSAVGAGEERRQLGGRSSTPPAPCRLRSRETDYLW